MPLRHSACRHSRSVATRAEYFVVAGLRAKVREREKNTQRFDQIQNVWRARNITCRRNSSHQNVSDFFATVCGTQARGALPGRPVGLVGSGVGWLHHLGLGDGPIVHHLDPTVQLNQPTDRSTLNVSPTDQPRVNPHQLWLTHPHPVRPCH
jgi:hypothetical protein